MAGHFLQALGFSSLLLLPVYLTHLGASRAVVGTVVATASVGGLVFRPAAAWALDVLGRKPAIVGGTLLLTLSLWLLAAVTDLGPLLYVDRVLYGVGEAALFPGYFALAADLIPPSRRTEGIALFGVTGLLPLVVNPFVDRLALAPADLRWFFPAMGVAVLASLWFVTRVEVPGPAPAAGDTAAPDDGAPPPLTVRRALAALAEPRLRPVWLATVVFAGLVNVTMAFGTVTARHRGLAAPGNIWLAYAAGAATVRLFAARLPDRVGTRNMVAPSIGVYVLAAVVLASAGTDELLLLGGALAGVGHGYGFPVLTSQVVTRTPDDLRGTGLVLFTALWELAALALTPALGAVADAAGDGALFATAALGATVGLAAWALWEHRVGAD